MFTEIKMEWNQTKILSEFGGYKSLGALDFLSQSRFKTICKNFPRMGKWLPKVYYLDVWFYSWKLVLRGFIDS